MVCCVNTFHLTSILLELYNHTNHQVAALNIWETSWPAYIDVLPYISLPLLPHLSHLAADTTLYGSLLNKSLIHDCWRKQSFSLSDFVHCLLQ